MSKTHKDVKGDEMKEIWEYSSLKEYKKDKQHMFNEHKLEYVDLGGKNCILKFKKPDTVVMAITFTYIDGVLTISGDLGYAIFNWCNQKNNILAHLNFKNIGYIMEKCVAYKEEDVRCFDSDLAQKELAEIFEENEVDLDRLPYFENKYERDCWCYEKAEELIRDAFETGIYKVGDYLGVRPFLWWTAFHLALEELERAENDKAQ